MSEPTYRQALAQAWILVWRNKTLWILGLLSVLFAGSFGVDNFIGKIMATLTGNNITFLSDLNLRSFLNLTPVNLIGLIWLSGIALAMGLLVIFISVCAKTSLLLAVVDFYHHKTVPIFGSIWQKSIKFFWKILSIELIKKFLLITMMAGFAAVWSQLPRLNSAWQTPVALLILSLIIFITLIIVSTSVYASGYAVIDEKPFWVSINNGWRLFRRHILVSLEISLILLLVDLAVLLVLFGVISVAFVPSMLIWLAAAMMGNYTLAIIGFLLGVLILTILIALVGAVYNTFTTSVWMYLFMKMHHENIFSRLFYHIGKLFTR